MNNASNKFHKIIKVPKEIISKTPEMYKLYTTHFKQIFENINYYLSKKNPYYEEVIEKIKLYLKKLTVDYELNGDKYIPIIIKSLIYENYKLAKNVLPDLGILLKNNFILGRIDIIKYKADLDNFLVKNIKMFTNENIINKKLNDLLIIILTHLDEIYKDEDIWIYLDECISNIIHNIYMINNIQGESFKKIYEFLFRIYNKFEREEKKQKKIKDDLVYYINYKLNLFSRFYNSEIFQSFENNINNNPYAYYLNQIYNKIDKPECIENSKFRNYNPIDLLVCRTIKNIVDTICFRYEEQKNNNNIEFIIEPLIPKKDSDFKKINFRQLHNPKIFNEYNYYSSYFGWCYICRKPASYYCIKYYLPVCGYQCKYLIQKEEDDLNKFSLSLVKDCSKMFEFFCKVLGDKKFFAHHKCMVFGLIEDIITRYGKIFNQSKMFILVIKNYLIDGLVRTSLCKDEKLFSPGIKMFFRIWKLCRQSLKKEIFFYTENTLIKILNSSYATFLHKKTVFECFINQDFFYFLELFVNYDYDINEKFILYNLISTFSEIIKGRFYKNSKNNTTYTEKENTELINYSLKIILIILHSILDFSTKFFQEKIIKDTYGQNQDNLSLTFSTDNNKKNCLTENNLKNIGEEYNNIYIKSTIKTNDLNINLNDTYKSNFYCNNSTITDYNYSELSENINKPKIDENKIKELFNKQKSKNINSNLDSSTNINNNSFLQKNLDYEIAVVKFNKNYEYGLSYLKTLGYIKNNSLDDKAKDINEFLLEVKNKNINKYNLFEFLGENTELSTKVLELFLEDFNFSNMNLVEAIKYFFWKNLPPLRGGEKFEKILKFFSKKYFTDNINNIFEDQEIIFYLSFAIIVITYSQEKIELDDFINIVNDILKNNNKNIMERKSLINIYNQVKKDSNMNINLSLNNFYSNNINIIKKIKYNNNRNIQYIEKKYKIINKDEIGEYLYQLILLIWKKVSVTFNIIIEESKEENIYKKGIEGIVYIIQILGLMELEQQKQTVISLICFMSNLLQVKVITEKNIFCIKQILFLANDDYRFCKGGWNSILKIINKLHFYYLLNSIQKNERDEYIKKLKNLAIEKDNLQKLSNLFTPNDYEKIFNKSFYFDYDTFIEFIKSMCEIARKEFIDNGLTKTFFLQKIVETAENNIFSNKKIIKINQVWKILSHFFVKVGSLNNSENSITCIDSLRQLVSKFLTKKECNENKFQNELFKPFLQIINITKNIETKEYIYSCINLLVKSNIKNIKSGWITIINIYKELSYINELNNMKIQVLDIFILISEQNFREINSVFNNFVSFLKLYIPSYPYKIMKIMNIIFKKINNENNYKSLIKLYLNLIINEDEEIRNKSLANINYNISKDYISSFNFLKNIYKKENFWKMIFQEIFYKSIDFIVQKISRFSSNNNISIINSIIKNDNLNLTFSETLTDISSSKSLNVKGTRNNINEKIKYSNSLYNIIINTINIFNNFFGYNYREFKNFLNILEKIVFYNDEKVQKIGIQGIKFLFGLEKIQNPIFLNPFIKFCVSVLNKSSGEELNKIKYEDIKNISNSKLFIHHIEQKIFLSHIHFNVLFLLENTLQKIIKILKYEEFSSIIEMFYTSYTNAIIFNSKINLRLEISSLLKINSTINLFQQFQISIKNYFFLLDYIFSNNSKEEIIKDINDKIFSSSEKILSDFIQKEKEKKILFENNNNKNDESVEKEYQEKELILKYYIGPINDNIFPLIKKAKFYEDDKYRDIFCKIFLEMISCDQLKIRENIKELLNMSFNIIFDKK